MLVTQLTLELLRLPYRLLLRRGPSHGRGLLPRPHISRASQVLGHSGPAEQFLCLFFKEIQPNTVLISKHHLLPLPLLELRSLRQIMPLISAWRAGWGEAQNDDPCFSDKDLPTPAPAALSKHRARVRVAFA